MEEKRFHEKCFACGKYSDSGLNLKFRLVSDKAVRGEFILPKNYQGYNGILHGGIIATILDSAMVHLFHLRDGLELKTVKLTVTYRKEIRIGEKYIVKASVNRTVRHFFRAESQICLGDLVLAEAEGLFRK